MKILSQLTLTGQMKKYLLTGFLFGVPAGLAYIKEVGTVAKVQGISMRPEFNPEPGTVDFIYLNKRSASSYRISRGDIVTLKSPKDPEVVLIKRIVGLENDVIRTKGYKTEFVRVPEGHCWVEGDNTGHTLDSNSFGPVSLNLITGKADYIIWPPSRWRLLKSKLKDEI